MPESIPDFDLYAVLGLTPDADDAAIRTAHRDAVRLAHPDVTPGGDTDDDLAKRLNVARDWLTDPARRARYDEARGGATSSRAAGVAADLRGTASTTAECGVTTGLGRRDAIGLLEVGWWLLLLVAAALIFATLLLIVAGI